MSNKPFILFATASILGFNLLVDANAANDSYDSATNPSSDNLRGPVSSPSSAASRAATKTTKQKVHTKSQHHSSGIGAVTGLPDRTAKTGVGMTDRTAKTGVGLTDRAAKSSVGLTDWAAKTTIGVPGKVLKSIF